MIEVNELLIPAQRQYIHNNGIGFVCGYDIDETKKIVSDIVFNNCWHECLNGYDMPECGIDVLTWDGCEKGIDFCDVDAEYGGVYFANDEFNSVTHWMPLPKDPK